MSTIKHTPETKQKADQLDAHGFHKDAEILKKDMRSASEVMYQDRLGHQDSGSVLPEHLRNEFPQQSGGLPTKPLAEEMKEDRFAKSNELHKEITTKASKVHSQDFNAGPVYNGFERGQVETTDKRLTANGFHGTANINEPTNPLVKDYLVQSQNNTFQQPQITANKPKDRSLIHSEEADRRAMGLGKNELTDRPDPNQFQTSTYNLTSAEPLHKQGGEDMVKDRPLGAEETKESLGTFQQSLPVQKEYMTMASKKTDDMTLGEKIMDTTSHAWNATKNWFAGKNEAEETGEKLAEKTDTVAEKAADTWETTKEKAADTWETTKEKASEGVDAIKDKASETKQSIVKEIPEKERQVKSTAETIKDKAESGLEAVEEKAGEAKKWAGEKMEEGGEALKDAGEQVKKTVTYVSDTMHEKVAGLWDKAHDRDQKLYVNEGSDKTQFEKVYEQAYEDAELNALDAKELLEEPHERAVQLKSTDLHNPIERIDESKKKEEVLQENAETASELLAPRLKEEDQKTAHQKKEEKAGKDKADLGLQDEKDKSLNKRKQEA